MSKRVKTDDIVRAFESQKYSLALTKDQKCWNDYMEFGKAFAWILAEVANSPRWQSALGSIVFNRVLLEAQRDVARLMAKKLSLKELNKRADEIQKRMDTHEYTDGQLYGDENVRCQLTGAGRKAYARQGLTGRALLRLSPHTLLPWTELLGK